VCWCKNVGIPEHRLAFRGITGKTLIKEVDVMWMESRGIPHGSAVIAFKDIERLR
jgi:hypothetical protein